MLLVNATMSHIAFDNSAPRMTLEFNATSRLNEQDSPLQHIDCDLLSAIGRFVKKQVAST